MDSGLGEVPPGRSARARRVDLHVAALDGGRSLHLLAAGSGGLGGEVVGALLGVDLPAEVDREADEHHHHEAGGDHPQGHRAAFLTAAPHTPGVHIRSRQVSSGLLIVAVIRRLPGTPGTARSERSSRHATVAVTDAD